MRRGNANESTRDGQESRPDPSPRLSDDLFYRALATGERRRLLAFLLEQGESTVEGLATALTGWDATETGTTASPDGRERIAVRLEHVHLPILAHAGLVAYDRERGTARVEQLDSFVEEIIHESVDAERPSRS